MRRRLRSLLSVLSALAIAGTLAAAPPAAGSAKIKPIIVISSDTGTLDPSRPTAQITGRVTARTQGGSPLPNLPVRLAASYELGTVTTNANGRFSAIYASRGQDSAVTARTDETADLEAGFGKTGIIRVRKAPTRMSLKADPADAGQPATVSGQVEWESPSGWLPFADKDVTLKVTTCNGPLGDFNLKTGPDGTFSTKIRPRCNATVKATAWSSDGLYEVASASTDLQIRPAVMLTVEARMDVWGLMSVSGTMNARDTNVTYNGQPLIIEHSPTGKAPWRQHRQIRVWNNGFRTQFRVGYSGHWRARFAGDALGMPAVSPARKILRWGTRMSKIKVSPARVRRNRPVTVSGTLTRYYNARQRRPTAFRGQNVRIIFLPRGKPTWAHVGWDKTDSRGRYVKKITARTDGHYAAIFYGTKDTWAIGSPNDAYVDTYRSALSSATGLGPVVSPPPLLPGDGTPANPASAYGG